MRRSWWGLAGILSSRKANAKHGTNWCNLTQSIPLHIIPSTPVELHSISSPLLSGGQLETALSSPLAYPSACDRPACRRAPDGTGAGSVQRRAQLRAELHGHV